MLRKCLVVGSFWFSILIGIIALFLPPTGVIDSSVLIFIAQLLLFCSAILGVNLNFVGYGDSISKKNNKDKENS